MRTMNPMRAHDPSALPRSGGRMEGGLVFPSETRLYIGEHTGDGMYWERNDARKRTSLCKHNNGVWTKNVIVVSDDYHPITSFPEFYGEALESVLHATISSGDTILNRLKVNSDKTRMVIFTISQCNGVTDVPTSLKSSVFGAEGVAVYRAKTINEGCGVFLWTCRASVNTLWFRTVRGGTWTGRWVKITGTDD